MEYRRKTADVRPGEKAHNRLWNEGQREGADVSGKKPITDYRMRGIRKGVDLWAK